MSTAAQIAANIANAQSSSGPRTEAGKAASSQNGITHGLFTMRDFVRPHEIPAYRQLTESLNTELAPVGVLETTLFEEIRGATWRLRRCGKVEANLVIGLDDGKNFIFDPMETPVREADRVQRSVDRARALSHRVLHKCTAELRKLQTERSRRENESGQTSAPAEPSLESLTTRTQSQPPTAPRNAPCPCGSGQKYKRCCARTNNPFVPVTPNHSEDASQSLKAA
jgi:hypothetical protein